MGLSKENLTIIIIAFATIFFDSMNYALIVPILPSLVKDLNSTSFQEGILFSSYSVFQLISLMIAGPLSDIYGRKLFLILSLVGSCLGSILQAVSRNMWELILWRSVTGLFAGSLILVQAVVADVTDAASRNTWLSRLEGIVSTAFIIGPAIGAILVKVNNRFPLYFAGVVSGIALLVALFFLKESHPKLRNKKKGEKQDNKDEKTAEKKKEKIKKLKPVRPKITSLMLLCFIFEFCNRWVINAFDSRYGFYLIDKFNAPSDHFSILVVVSSIICCLLQLFAYPWLVSTKNIPVPYLACIGMIIEFFSYIAMSALPTEMGSMIASLVLWCGFCCVSPASVSIISTSTSPDIQGTVLSWNNFCNQASLISCPLILSTIYAINYNYTYYFSSIFSFIGACIMGYLSTRKNAKSLGRVSKEEGEGKEEKEKEEEKEVMDIEMKPMESLSNESGKDGDNSPITTVVETKPEVIN